MFSAISPNKPIVIAETSCNVQGGSIPMKNTWLSNLYPYSLLLLLLLLFFYFLFFSLSCLCINVVFRWIAGTNKVQMIVMFNTDADGLFCPKCEGNLQLIQLIITYFVNG